MLRLLTPAALLLYPVFGVLCKRFIGSPELVSSSPLFSSYSVGILIFDLEILLLLSPLRDPITSPSIMIVLVIVI